MPAPSASLYGLALGFALRIAVSVSAMGPSPCLPGPFAPCDPHDGPTLAGMQRDRLGRLGTKKPAVARASWGGRDGVGRLGRGVLCRHPGRLAGGGGGKGGGRVCRYRWGG